jgi:YggT family protein
MASPTADPPQHHASTPPLLLAVRHIPFPGVHRPRALPAPDVLTPIARRLEELASAAAAHPLLKPLFAVHSHLSSFSQVSTKTSMDAVSVELDRDTWWTKANPDVV